MLTATAVTEYNCVKKNSSFKKCCIFFCFNVFLVILAEIIEQERTEIGQEKTGPVLLFTALQPIKVAEMLIEQKSKSREEKKKERSKIFFRGTKTKKKIKPNRSQHFFFACTLFLLLHSNNYFKGLVSQTHLLPHETSSTRVC